MQSIPEILIGKNIQQWRRLDLFFFSVGTAVVAIGVWILFLGGMNYIQPRLFFPTAVLFIITPFYGFLIFALTFFSLWNRLPKPKRKAKPPVKKSPSSKMRLPSRLASVFKRKKSI